MAAPRTAPADKPRPLGVRATAEQRRILAEAAKREHRSVSSFVLQAALGAAGTAPQPEKKRHTPEEVQQVLADLRAAFLRANPHNPDIVAEFIAERHAEAARE